jgi:urea transport system ATP-binding protein
MSALLEVSGVSVTFDGFRAINNLSFSIGPAELRAIIGPNGAGKTTFMDIVTGKTRPDAGRVTFGERSISLLGMNEARIAREGIGRKFQRPTVFEDQTVEDNLILALKANRSPWAVLFWRPRPPTWTGCRPWPRRWAWATSCTASRASCRTGRSNGWKSPCCWRRSLGFCWWTSPPPG